MPRRSSTPRSSARSRSAFPTSSQAIISTHCHDDLGLAVANSLAGCEAGARQVECTINGIGERAGNAALEEVVMALKTRFDYYGLTTGIKTERLYPVSRMLSTITGLAVQRNKAIVGRNAFAHEAGIHQDGMLKERSTYEIMRPEDVGVPRTDLVLGKHSGRHALRERVTEMGYTPDRRAARDAVPRLQGAGRQEEGSLRRRPDRPDRKVPGGRAGALAVGQPAHDGRALASCPRPRSASAVPTARSFRTPPSATARSTRSSRPSSGSRASAPTCASSSSGA